MNRPTSLIRSSSDAPEFQAPASNIKKNAIDCGITVIPGCLPACFHRFATPNWFLFFLTLLGIVQGSTQKYFSTSARHVGEVFGFSDETIDWLLVSHDIFMGLFIISVAYWGNRIHRPAWIGGLACIQGFSCFTVMLPYLGNMKGNETMLMSDPLPNLCVNNDPIILNLELAPEEQEYHWIMLILLFVLQLFIGLGNATFFTLGITYLDDNVEDVNSPIYISFAIAVKLSSFQFGTFMAWSFLHQDKSWWIGYPILGGMLIVFGTFVAFFPLQLIGTIIKQAAASILNIARNSMENNLNIIPKEAGFGKMFVRIVKNKILFFNTLAVVFMQMAMENFRWYESDFMESQFYLPRVGVGFDDPWTSRLWKNFTKPPIIAMVILITGLFISKINPRARIIAGWSVGVTVVVAAVFYSFGFLDCQKDNISGIKYGRLAEYCSFSCDCHEYAKFEPVCTQDTHQTFYSPCHAGCKSTIDINGIMMYGNCSCSSLSNQNNRNTTIATPGACDNEKCSLYWILFQSFTVFAGALLGSSYVGNFLIILRSVCVTDKALALGYHLGLVNLLVHIPGKFIYKAISDSTCQYNNESKKLCNMHTTTFGEILSFVTSGLLVLSAVMYMVVLYLVDDIVIIGPYHDVESEFQSPRSRESFRTQSTLEANNAYSIVLPRRLRQNAVNSGASTTASSIQYSLAEEQPLNPQPELREMRPFSREEAHRSVIEEFKTYKSTQI